ncbi:hypothetical protein SESBI_44039 [Sesbania bispinosa]|nr:hypothetical protein SESBI_44039 [Sesbania bispinosa]
MPPRTRILLEGNLLVSLLPNPMTLFKGVVVEVVVESVRDELAHEFERLDQTEGMPVSKYSARFTQLSSDRRRMEAVVEIFARNNGLRDRRVVISSQCWCGIRAQLLCAAESGHIRRDCPVVVTQPSSSHASTPAGLASSQAPSAPVRQLGCSSSRGSVVAQKSGRGLVVEFRHRKGEVRLGFLTRLVRMLRHPMQWLQV